MEEIRIKIHGNIPYDIVFDTIRDLLFDEIGEEDTFLTFHFFPPALDYKLQIIYTKRKLKIFEAWKIR